MSRIDQAFRVREEDRLGELPASVPVSSDSPLGQYGAEAHEPRVAQRSARPQIDPNTTPVHEGTPHPQRLEKSNTDARLQARLVTGGAGTVAIEQYRRLAAVLHEEQVQRQLRTVMVTSALPREGKTLTVVNIALTLSESYGRRVLVVDADLRWPSLHRPLGITNHDGLSEALRSRDTNIGFTEVSNRLWALTAGHPGPNPLAGLTSPRMGEILAQCAAQFDWVLIDTSPVGLLPDAQVLANLIGAVIFVIGAGSTPSATIERAISQVGTDCIVGMVLNRVERHRIHEAGYYGQYGAEVR